MKILRTFFIVLLCGCLLACNKNTTSTPTSAMSASINGGSTITFTASFTNSNGVMVLQGSSNTYTIQLYMQIAGPGIQYFQSSPSYPYATVTDISGSYSTSTANQNQVTITAGSTAGLYNGSFSFTGTGSAGSISVNGQFTNM